MLSYGVSILFSSFANAKKVKKRMPMALTDVIADVTKHLEAMITQEVRKRWKHCCKMRTATNCAYVRLASAARRFPAAAALGKGDMIRICGGLDAELGHEPVEMRALSSWSGMPLTPRALSSLIAARAAAAIPARRPLQAVGFE